MSSGRPLISLGLIIFILVTLVGVARELLTQPFRMNAWTPSVANVARLPAAPAHRTETVRPASGSIAVMAPVEPQWSEKIATPGPFTDEADGPARVRTSSGRIFDIDKGSKVNLGQTSYLQFQSRTTEPVNITVRMGGFSPRRW